MYDDGGDPLAEGDAMGDAKGEMSDEKQTALLPKNFFGGKELEPGRECKVKIQKVYDDEVMVEYVPHGEKESSDEGDMAENPVDEMDALMTDA